LDDRDQTEPVITIDRNSQVAAAGIADDRKGRLFRTSLGTPRRC
jgi:hypothetical protein